MTSIKQIRALSANFWTRWNAFCQVRTPTSLICDEREADSLSARRTRISRFYLCLPNPCLIVEGVSRCTSTAALSLQTVHTIDKAKSLHTGFWVQSERTIDSPWLVAHLTALRTPQHVWT